jgi:hypothetical protein
MKKQNIEGYIPPLIGINILTTELDITEPRNEENFGVRGVFASLYSNSVVNFYVGDMGIGMFQHLMR